jgi:hypothetical protein
MSNYQCEVCGKANIDTPDGYIEECNCLDKTMKPNNISDVINSQVKFTDGKVTIAADFHESMVLISEKLLRHQIEQLLGRIDTGETTFPEKESDDFDDGYNQKSSEIANQIKEMKI